MTEEDFDADQLEAHSSSSRHSGAQLLETKTNNNKQFSRIHQENMNIIF